MKVSITDYQNDIFAHRLLEGAVEPAVVDHVLDGDRRVLQVLKRVHQDEVQHYVIEVQVLDLPRMSS